MIRFAIMYFSMLVLFLVLLIAPLVVRKMGIIKQKMIEDFPVSLLQPLDGGGANNDTTGKYTGSGLPNGFSAWVPPSASATS